MFQAAESDGGRHSQQVCCRV